MYVVRNGNMQDSNAEGNVAGVGKPKYHLDTSISKELEGMRAIKTCLCIGPHIDIPLHYQVCRFHSMINKFIAEYGDKIVGYGIVGESIYSLRLENENLGLTRVRKGVFLRSNSIQCGIIVRQVLQPTSLQGILGMKKVYGFTRSMSELLCVESTIKLKFTREKLDGVLTPNKSDCYKSNECLVSYGQAL